MPHSRLKAKLRLGLPGNGAASWARFAKRVAFFCAVFGLCFSAMSVEAKTRAQHPEGSTRVPDDPMSRADVFRAMSLTSKAFRNATETVLPALVSIESYGGVGARQGRIGGIRKQGEGNTTGIMISSDGYVLTSTFNFIQQPPIISVIPSDGKRRFAKLVGRDDTRKICLLKIEDVEDMPVAKLVSLDAIEVGQWAVSLGVGYGDASPAISMGVISAKNRIGGRAIQTDANISPANYGGPLINIEGHVMGICVPMNPQSQAIGAGVEWYDSGIGFAIPIAGAEAVIERLKAGERISPAYLGVQAMPNPSGKGLWIERADEVGLLRGDVILGVNDEKVADMLRLRQVLNRFESGQEIELVILKDGTDKETKVKIVLGVPPRPKEEEQLEAPKIR
jgi:serine protease Do